MRLASLALIILASAHVACGGKAIADEFNADSGLDSAGSDTSSIPTDGPIGTEASPSDVAPDGPKPTATTCTKFVGGICNSKTEACCKVAGFPWDKDACNTGLDYYCNALVDEVALGRATYNESFLDACVKGWEESLTKCEVSGLESAKYQIPCAQLFNGIIALGEKCKGNRYAECKAPPGFGAYCDIRPGSKEGICRGYGFVGMGAPCNYTGTTIRYCDTDLYCDVTSAMSTCKTQKKLGEACGGPDDYSCGFTARCTEGKCTSLGAEGAACMNNEECISYECDGGKCNKPTNPVVSSWMCNGTM
jgi:hypothetical protein